MFAFEVANMWGTLLMMAFGLWWRLYRAVLLLKEPDNAAVLSKSLAPAIFLGGFFSLYLGWLAGELREGNFKVGEGARSFYDHCDVMLADKKVELPPPPLCV